MYPLRSPSSSMRRCWTDLGLLRSKSSAGVDCTHEQSKDERPQQRLDLPQGHPHCMVHCLHDTATSDALPN